MEIDTNHQSTASSVEEAVEDMIIIESDFKARSRSPKYVPRFLRSYFSRLITKRTAPTTDSTKKEMVRARSPATMTFVEESLARGLPLIPFHYTSLDMSIVERGRARNKETVPE